MWVAQKRGSSVLIESAKLANVEPAEYLCTDPKKLCKATAPVPDGTACGENNACSHGECSLRTLTFSIPRINAGVYVRSEHPEAPEAHVHIAVDGRLLVAQLSLAEPCVKAATHTHLFGGDGRQLEGPRRQHPPAEESGASRGRRSTDVLA